MTKGPISTAKRAPVTAGAASRAARADGRAAGVVGSRAISGVRVTLGSSREAGAAAPGLSSELSRAPVFSAGLATGGGSGGAASDAGVGSRAGGGVGAGAGEIGGARAGAGVRGSASSFSRRSALGPGWPRSNPARQPTTPATRAPARIAIRAMRSARRLLVARCVGTGWVAADGTPTDPPIPAAAGTGARLSTSLAPEEPSEERGGPIEALLVGVDDGLLAVVVGVVMRVRVPGDLRLDVVQDHAPDFATDVLDVDLGALENEAPDLPCLVHQDHAVGLRRDDRRARDRHDGWRVDQNDVVLVAHGAKERGHRGRRQELGGGGRDGARLDDVQVVEARRGHDVFHLEAAHQDVGDGAEAVAPRP